MHSRGWQKWELFVTEARENENTKSAIWHFLDPFLDTFWGQFVTKPGYLAVFGSPKKCPERVQTQKSRVLKNFEGPKNFGTLVFEKLALFGPVLGHFLGQFVAKPGYLAVCRDPKKCPKTGWQLKKSRVPKILRNHQNFRSRHFFTKVKNCDFLGRFNKAPWWTTGSYLCPDFCYGTPLGPSIFGTHFWTLFGANSLFNPAI